LRLHGKLLVVLLVGVVLATLSTGAGGRPGAARDRYRARGRPRLLAPVAGTGASQTMRPGRTAAEWPGMATNFDVLGHARMRSGGVGGDVWFFDHGAEGKFAYIGTWVSPCPGGVKIVDVTDPNNPKLVAKTAGRRGVDFQDMVVRTVGDRDILAVGLQKCSYEGRGGLALYDVTTPTKPKFLSFLKTPSFGVHELDLAVRSDGRALALMAVNYVEQSLAYGGPDRGGEFRIAEVTDPRNPVEIADWGIIADSDIPRSNSTEPIEFPGQGMGNNPVYFNHSVRSADNGNTAYASYWDAGVLKFDITDPANPHLVGRTTFPIDAAGDAHSVTTYDHEGTRYLLQNQEEYDPLSPATITTSATGASEYSASEEFWMPTILTEAGAISGEAYDAGDGCQANDYSGAAGKVALVDWPDPLFGAQPPCEKMRQILNAAKADALALMINVISEERPFVFPLPSRKIRKQARDLVVVEISSLDSLASAIRTAAGPHTLTLTPNTPSWGTLRIYSEDAASDLDGDGILEYDQVSDFNDLPHVTGSIEDVTARGFWSIHNTEVNGNRAYAAWYSHGIVAIDVSNPTSPVLTGQWVPPSNNERRRFLGKGPAEVWGVAIPRPGSCTRPTCARDCGSSSRLAPQSQPALKDGESSEHSNM
jgi:hypothetical protein